MELIDWDALWRIYMLALRRFKEPSFWDGQASRDEEWRESLKELTSKQLEVMDLGGCDTLLEVGPGAGRLTIPLARLLRRVTVVEPSALMIEALKRNAEGLGIDNITYVNKSWEETRVGVDIASHDLVLASLSLLMPDLRDSLVKMERAADKAVYIFLSADSYIPEDIQRILFGGRVPFRLSDHLIVYNLLNSIGIRANVSMLEFNAVRRFKSLEDALSEYAEAYQVPEGKLSELRGYLSGLLTERDGFLWQTSRRRVAALWWRKS